MTLALFLMIRNWEKASFYAFQPDECHEMAAPLANIGPKLEKLFKLPGWVHIVVTASDDVVTLLFTMVGYFQRIGLLDKLLPNPEIKKEVQHNVERNGHSQEIQKSGTEGYVDLRTVPGFGQQYNPNL